MKSLNVFFLPKLIEPEQLVGGTCVVIDVLRATTTIAWALHSGAKEVIPCLEVEDARHMAASLPAGSFLLGGERHGKRIEGFDLGNSPAEYSAEVVAGRSIVFTTSNGTRALLACAAADQILCGAFVNLTAVCNAIQSRPRINLICAGTDGRVSREDVLLAGAVVDRLSTDEVCTLNDQALIARSAWQPLRQFDNKKLAEELSQSHGGRNLIELAMASDVQLSCICDQTQVVPYFDRGRIMRLDGSPVRE